MQNIPRPVIILFVIIIVLFACGVCSGATLQANRPIDLDVGWVKSLGNTFARPQALPRQEIRVALEELLAATRRIEPDGPVTREFWHPNGLRQLPLRFIT
jgi:hypothetical protein